MKMIKFFDGVIFLFFLFYVGLFVTDYSFIFSGGISNVSGPTVGLLFLFITRFILDKKSFALNPAVKLLTRISCSDEKKFVFFSSFLLFFTILLLSIARHLSLSSGSFDLGIFDQAIWNTLNGDFLFSSIRNNMCLMGDHFEPLLVAIVPLYKLFPSVYLLLIVQSALLASAIIPLYLLAKLKNAPKIVIFAFIVSFVLSRGIRGIGFSDFHLECFILPLLFWAYYFLIKKNNFLFLLAIILLLSAKEDMAFLVSSFGIFAFFFQKRRLLGINLLLLGLGAWFVETRMIVPFFNPKGLYEHINKLPFGMTYGENIKALISSPSLLIKSIASTEKLKYCIKLFGPLGFLPLLSPSHYILIAVPLVKNLLAEPRFSGYYNITSHYTATVLPFLYIAALYAVCSLLKKTKSNNMPVIISVFLVIFSLFFYGKTDSSKLSKFVYTIKHEETLKKISYLRMIPENAVVATNFNLVPHLSHRKYVFDWNPSSKTSQEAQYLIIDLSLLGYLTNEDRSKIASYFSEIEKKGYKKIFLNNEKNFIIYFYPKFDLNSINKPY